MSTNWLAVGFAAMLFQFALALVLLVAALVVGGVL